MATYTVNDFSAGIAGITFTPSGRQNFIVITFDPGSDTLISGDKIIFPSNFSTKLKEKIAGYATVCSISVFRQSNINPWGFVRDLSNAAGANREISLTLGSINTGSTYGYFETFLNYYYNNSWRNLGWGVHSAGSYTQDDNFFTEPLILLKNSRTNKYILFTEPKGGAAFFDNINPGIINNHGMIVSLMAVNPYNYSENSVLYFGEIENGAITPIIETSDPYLPNGVDPSGSGGGTGTFSETGDTVGIPGLPTLSAVDTGFITLFNPSAAQVKSLANYMWSSSFDLATFKNIVANPIDCILGLAIVPVDPPNAGSKVVTVGNIATNITLPYLSSQYVEVDCGTLNVQEFWGSYLDYSPYTKMSLYLPYIGIIPLDIDDVMNASISIKYHVDVLSGACVAYVLCNGTQLYTYVGQCSSNVPITSNDFTNTVNGILGIAGSIGKLAADGGASAPTEAAGIAANAVNALKPNIQKSGAMSGTGGLMGVQTPYLICQRPRQSVPASQNTYTGYPSNITAQLSDLSGYTEVESIHLDGLSATQEEQQEIMDLLTSGVII